MVFRRAVECLTVTTLPVGLTLRGGGFEYFFIRARCAGCIEDMPAVNVRFCERRHVESLHFLVYGLVHGVNPACILYFQHTSFCRTDHDGTEVFNLE